MMTNVLVFRTNINSAKRYGCAHRTMGRLLKGQGRWTVDMNDYDCVLRIETESVTEATVVSRLTRAGLECTPLE